MKKWLGRIAIALIGIMLSLLILDRILFIQNKNKYQYKDQVGYLKPTNPDYHDSFKRCSEFIPYGTYSSTRSIFSKDKGSFTHYIKSTFNDNNYTDNGILNLRFLINCQGAIGDVETNELDFDFNQKDLNDALVIELMQLSFKKENWNYELQEETDYYMYLIYRIENGKVVEILP